MFNASTASLLSSCLVDCMYVVITNATAVLTQQVVPVLLQDDQGAPLSLWCQSLLLPLQLLQMPQVAQDQGNGDTDGDEETKM